MASEELCRTCMSGNSDLQPIFYGKKSMDRSLPEIIAYVAGVTIAENDGLPNSICNSCIGLAQSALVFKEQCHTSEAEFKKFSAGPGLQGVKKDQDMPADDAELNRSSQIKKEMDHIVEDLSSLDNDNVTADGSASPNNCNEITYQCALCTHRFALCAQLKDHVIVEHDTEPIAPVTLRGKTSEARISKAKLSCQVCSKSFTSKKNLANHVLRCEARNAKRNREKEIKQEVISSDSDDDTPLADNLRRASSPDISDSEVINDESIKIEPQLSLLLDNAQIDLSVKSLRKKTYSCTECDETLTFRMFKIHMKKYHPKTIPESMLSKLKRKMLNGSNGMPEKKKMKRKAKSKESFEEFVEDWKDSDANGLEKPPVPYSCTMCERKFLKLTTLNLHLKKHEEQLSEVHTCLTCKQEFKRRAHLDKHILTHSVDKGFKCDFCPKAFARQDSLIMHVDNHRGLKKHQCNFCEKGFNMLSTLKDHIRTHTGEKPFLCSICGRGFSQSTNLKEHVRRHLGFKPFKCNYCDQTFVSKGELEAHTRKHSGAHPFVCVVCGGGFTTSSSLVKHKRIHTGERPYQCDFCPMRFTALGTLTNHRRTHTGEKPYKCIYCDKAFAQKNDLVSHTRTHTGERPYVCTVCGHAFRRSSALKTHFKIHGGVPDSESVKLEGQ